MSVIKIDHIHSSEPSDKPIIIRFLILSVITHAVVIILPFLGFTRSTTQIKEWSIETDLVSSVDLGSAQKTILPRAKKAEKAAVPSNLLPQLPKNFEIKKQQTGEQDGVKTVADSKSKEKQDLNEGSSSAPVETKAKAASELRKSEALRRLAVERLRKMQKERSREYKAQESSDVISSLKSHLKHNAGVGKNQGGLISTAAMKKYARYLSKTIKRNYSLPKTFEVTRADVRTLVHIKLNSRGELVNVSISTSSGDDVFDQNCLDAIKRSAPFKAPPKAQAGEIIPINCTPN